MACGVALWVFGIWYPHPYDVLAGGREIFLIAIAIDVICGPIMTGLIASPNKKTAELKRDVAMIACIQLVALCYGVNVLWQARPLFLVHELHRFKVISKASLLQEDFDKIPHQWMPAWYRGPSILGIKRPTDETVQGDILFEVLAGGRDYAERPEFYVPYDAQAREQVVRNAQPLSQLLQQKAGETELVAQVHQKISDVSQYYYTEVIGRSVFYAVIDSHGEIQFFIPEMLSGKAPL